MNRREFLKASLLSTASLALSPGCQSPVPVRQAPAPVRQSGVLGANSDIRLAVIGLNGRGKTHIEEFQKIPGVRLVALCDPDRNVLDKAVGKCQDLGASLQGYTDIRRLLESKDLDAVSIATPNHWHSLGAIW